MTPKESRYRFSTCCLCEAMCGLRIEVEGGRIVTIKGDEEDPLSRGYICPKAPALQYLHEDPDRLRQPMRRTESGWRPMSWDDALQMTAERLHSIQSTHGNDGVGIYMGNPILHNLGVLLIGPTFLRSLGTRNRFSSMSVDQLPHMLAAYLMFGHQLLFPVPDIDRTQYMLILGANPLASNGGMMAAPGYRRRLRALQARGGRLVVIDPRRTETARMADEHIFIRPGTDALLLLGILNTLLAEDRAAPAPALAYSDGLPELRRAVMPFTPERAEVHTRVPAETIRRLARELASAEAAVCYGRMGTSTQPFGAICQWSINAINIVTGNFDRPGGVMFTRPALDPVSVPEWLGIGKGSFGLWKSRVRGLPEFGGELPAAVMAEEMQTPGPGQIRGLITLAGNPVLSTPRGSQLDRALASLDFMVSVDIYLNETTRHAHVILPPVSPLERPHYDVIFNLLAVRNSAKYAHPVFAPPPGSRHDWEILLDLQHRLTSLRGRVGWKGRLLHAGLRRLGAEGLLGLGIRLGPHGIGRGGIDLEKLRGMPHGKDLGPLQPCMPRRLYTPGKRISLAPSAFVRDLARLGESFPGHREAEAVDAPLLLIGRRHLRSNNSWMHNLTKLMQGRPRCTLMVHSQDAQRLGLEDGGNARIRSRVGEIVACVEITDDMMPGTVSFPHGFGHDRDGIQLGVARRYAGVSVNDITDDAVVDQLCGNAAFNGLPVSVSPA